ncbi:hypothetical protein E2C01_014197 [Portunus trituberculatus]|uniref:Uncharacterized protein n=1 Tax=Portunus trituberculatus TaxID=210409 RepID=A0A5B7DIJ2_PORTR|nr:hypothetical protein [Portunus trituberculatus]
MKLVIKDVTGLHLAPSALIQPESQLASPPSTPRGRPHLNRTRVAINFNGPLHQMTPCQYAGREGREIKATYTC